MTALEGLEVQVTIHSSNNCIHTVQKDEGGGEIML